jgi:hypothetical protein
MPMHGHFSISMLEHTRTQNPNENAPVYMFSDDDAAANPKLPS